MSLGGTASRHSDFTCLFTISTSFSHLGNSRLIVYPLQLAGEMRTKYLVLGRKLCNYMIFNGIHLFSRNEDFGETQQKSHFLLILAI